jgi:hypothetical protein
MLEEGMKGMKGIEMSHNSLWTEDSNEELETPQNIL